MKAWRGLGVIEQGAFTLAAEQGGVAPAIMQRRICNNLRNHGGSAALVSRIPPIRPASCLWVD